MIRPILCAALLVATFVRVAAQQPVLHSPLIPANGLPVRCAVLAWCVTGDARAAA